MEPGREGSGYSTSSTPLLPGEGRSVSASPASILKQPRGRKTRLNRDGTPAEDDREEEDVEGVAEGEEGHVEGEGSDPEDGRSSPTITILEPTEEPPSVPPPGSVAELEVQRILRQKEQEIVRNLLHAQRQEALLLDLQEQQLVLKLVPSGDWQPSQRRAGSNIGLWGGANAAAAMANSNYSFDLGREQLRRERKLHGLPPSSSVSTK